ncbi:hypothetical protein, partial [Parabacteroides sp. AM08-6]|uniref:hypothetical protein n=1 Tax=Parabacteroides sp. AM08-6 TaxID=2292053 RepID=UPI0018F7CCF0
GWYNIKTDGREDMLTMGTDSAAIFRRISADGLKASYGEADFKLWIDTAANNANGDLNVPTYFILKGREYSEDKDTMSGNFLGRTRNDSLMFVEAKRIVNKDTLLIGDNKLKGNDVKPYQFAFPFV